jgi:alpha-ribazole phosphatase
MTDTIIDLIRHGEPQGGRRFRGNAIDDPLTEKGWQQMWNAVAQPTAWTHIISSPLQRCQQFAKALAERQGITASVDDRLKEVGFGCWEGKTPAQLQAQDAQAYNDFYQDPLQHRPEGAESWADFSARVSSAVEDIASQYAGQHILLVTHAGVIRAAAAMVLEAPALGAYRMKINNASLSRIHHHGQRYRLEYLNRSA